MMDLYLQRRLDRVIRRQKWTRAAWQLALCWLAFSILALGMMALAERTAWNPLWLMPLIAALAAGASMTVLARLFARPNDYRAAAADIERCDPELNGVLLTAVQQTPTAPGGQPDYLQYRVMQQAVELSATRDWRKVVPRLRLLTAHALHAVAFVAFALTLAGLQSSSANPRTVRPLFVSRGVTVTPGDVNLERGESLVVLVRFGSGAPAAVDLVIREHGATAKKIPLVKSLADPVFGGSVPEVKEHLTYRVEYGRQHSRDFKVTVFEHPRLERSDVTLTYPTYTKLPPKRIEDTRRVSAVEGSRLELALQLNKPVRSARLVARDAEKTTLTLQVSDEKAVATLPPLTLAKSATYDVHLVDADGRANKTGSTIIVDVLGNRVPELKLTSPRGDVRPSALEEITFNGTVWDDFGMPAHGIAYTPVGQETKFIELSQNVPAGEKRPFTHVLALEDLGVAPDQLISWYLWADDTGPDGKIRRTVGDMYFAEVRPFDEIFRENQSAQSDEQPSQQQGTRTRRLTEIQKQIISATWKLQREPAVPKYADDANVVLQSQQQALEQASAAREEATEPRAQGQWTMVTKEMERAITRLREAANSPAPLSQALVSEQAAYQGLLKLQARETQVNRSSSSRGGQGGEQQATQRQLEQLDLAQSENRYETQRQAAAPQNPERREQSQIMNRLQELARRQEDLNERLKELQTALQEARSENEREQIRRQLKRLQDEQRQMLADVDELRQRMDRPENQSRLAEQRQQLEQARQELQRAAEAAGDGSVGQAVASGTRAQRQLQTMRDELRKQNSSQFSEELRDMRNDARELSRHQQEIAERIRSLQDDKRKTLTDAPERQAVTEQLQQQKERMKELVDRATQVSQQAESSEPLLARELYDSLRKLAQDDAASAKELRQELLNNGLMTRSLYEQMQQSADGQNGRALELTRSMVREGYLPQAGQAEQRARAGIEELKRGVERATESVLGDDGEALRLARAELDAVTEQLQREIAQAGQGDASRPDDQSGNPDANQVAQNEETGGNQQVRDAARPGTEASSGATANETPAELAGRSARERNGTPAAGPNPDRAHDLQPGGSQAGGAQTGDRMASDVTNRGGARPENGGPREVLRRGRREPVRIDELFAGGGGTGGGNVIEGPLTGGNFAEWSDRLRDVEEVLDDPELRNAVATARERARLARQDYKSNLKKPDWAVVQLQIVKPLVEVRSRIAEELARRESRDSLVPIDRDPVPNRYAESVRKYYEELGREKPAEKKE